jgi:predicted O-methyltransferase YrrM
MLEEILKFDDGPVKYEKSGRGHVKMVGHSVPYSVMQKEWDFLHNIVVDNNLKRGFELATAFGVSGSAIGTAMKKTGGKLVTMDAYIEEKCNNAGTYEKFERQVYEQSDGYKSVKYLIKKLEIENHMIAEIGWSPDDVDSIITRNFTEKLDFVFLDAGHFGHQMIKDIEAIKPHLADKFVFVFHDIYPWSCTKEVHDCVIKHFGRDIEIKLPYPDGENMGVIINL